MGMSRRLESSNTDKISNGHSLMLTELLWPSNYELRLSLERLWVLILVKVIGE